MLRWSCGWKAAATSHCLRLLSQKTGLLAGRVTGYGDQLFQLVLPHRFHATAE